MRCLISGTAAAASGTIHGDAHHLRTGGGQLEALLRGGGDVGGVGIGHGLNDDGRAATDGHVADLHAMSLLSMRHRYSADGTVDFRHTTMPLRAAKEDYIANGAAASSSASPAGTQRREILRWSVRSAQSAPRSRCSLGNDYPSRVVGLAMRVRPEGGTPHFFAQEYHCREVIFGVAQEYHFKGFTHAPFSRAIFL